MATGGSIESISLAGRTFAVAADADSNRELGGLVNEVVANGDGSARIQKTRKPWMLDGLQIVVDDLRNDHEFLQNLSDQNDFYPTDITYASGAIYAGPGQIVGDMQVSSQSTTASVSLSGPGRLQKQ